MKDGTAIFLFLMWLSISTYSTTEPRRSEPEPTRVKRILEVLNRECLTSGNAVSCRMTVKAEICRNEELEVGNMVYTINSYTSKPGSVTMESADDSVWLESEGQKISLLYIKECWE